MESVIALYPDWLHDNQDQCIHHIARMVRDERSRNAYPLVDVLMRMGLQPSIMSKLRLLCVSAPPTESATDCLFIVEEFLRRADSDVTRKFLQRDVRHKFVKMLQYLLPVLIEKHPLEWPDDMFRLVKVVQDVLTRLSAH